MKQKTHETIDEYLQRGGVVTILPPKQYKEKHVSVKPMPWGTKVRVREVSEPHILIPGCYQAKRLPGAE